MAYARRRWKKRRGTRIGGADMGDLVDLKCRIPGSQRDIWYSFQVGGKSRTSSVTGDKERRSSPRSIVGRGRLQHKTRAATTAREEDQRSFEVDHRQSRDTEEMIGSLRQVEIRESTDRARSCATRYRLAN